MSASTHPSAVATPVALTVSAPASPANQAPPGLAPTTPIPPDKEQLLFNAIFDAESPLVDIARTFDVSVSSLAVWAAQPHIRARLIEIAEFARLRAHLLAAERTSRAVHTLDTVSMFFMSEMEGDNPGAAAKRRDVSRKSAMDTLRIGLRPIRDLFPIDAPPTTHHPSPTRTHPAPDGHLLYPPQSKHLASIPIRPNNPAEHLLALAGAVPSHNRAAGSAAASASPAATNHRPVAGVRSPAADAPDPNSDPPLSSTPPHVRSIQAEGNDGATTPPCPPP
jgi:hypothetical protein